METCLFSFSRPLLGNVTFKVINILRYMIKDIAYIKS